MRKIDNSEEINVVKAFVQELVKLMKLKNCLKIAISNFSVFETSELSVQITNKYDWETKLCESDKFDLILGDLPLGMDRQNYEFGDNKLKTRKNWIEILKSIKYLHDDGVALFLVEPSGFSFHDGEQLEKSMNANGYFVNGIFNCPQGILQPQTTITPILVLITKAKTNSLFVAELLNNSQSKQVANNYCSKVVSGDLIRGMEIEERAFRGFHQIKIKQQIEKLETQYKEFEEYSIGEIAVEINSVPQSRDFTERANSVYIPKIGHFPVVSRITDIKHKHHYYFQVVLGEKTTNEYVAAFFQSDLGRLVLQSLTLGTVVPTLNKKNLEQATIALPSFDIQEQILATQRKLRDLKNAIESFDCELALNPTSSISILGQLDSMSKAINSLTEVDEVLNLIRQGESKNIEFKQTFSLDVKKKTKEQYIETSALKTIVAFLNTEGGILLVGVADDAVITGIDIEIDKFHKGSTDKFLLHIKNRIKTKIGEEFYAYIDSNLINVSKKNILVVKCKKSKSPCFLDNAEFYVRTNPATDKLEGPKLVEYIKNNFSQ